MIKLGVLLVCVAISYAEPLQRQSFYLPVQFSQHHDVESYHYVPVVQQPFLRPVSGSRLPSPSYPTLVRLPLPALPADRRQFRLPSGGYFIVPASALHGKQQASSIQTAQTFFRPIGLATAPQVRPTFASAPEDDECLDDSADHESTEDIEEKK